mmetsp:Transcript_93029/g.268710  ORF Transcript_93029/g.268710 Transcript_93029/m.268710 type:complete len:209 (-) Transcript_93029:80-706(-)
MAPDVCHFFADRGQDVGGQIGQEFFLDAVVSRVEQRRAVRIGGPISGVARFQCMDHETRVPEFLRGPHAHRAISARDISTGAAVRVRGRAAGRHGGCAAVLEAGEQSAKAETHTPGAALELAQDVACLQPLEEAGFGTANASSWQGAAACGPGHRGRRRRRLQQSLAAAETPCDRRDCIWCCGHLEERRTAACHFHGCGQASFQRRCR